MTVDEALELVRQEIQKARAKHAPMNSAHEGYAVILEELDEAWVEIKADRPESARKEMLQVAAMAVCFMVEVK